MGKKKKRAESELANAENFKEQTAPHLANGDSKEHKKIKKKKRAESEPANAQNIKQQTVLHLAKSKEVKEENVLKEKPTVSIAIAGSIIDNTQSLELATRVTQ